LHRDFRRLLAQDPCWDASTQAAWERHGYPAQDVLLQNREELIAFCEWIERSNIRTYLEIGVWTGRLVSVLHRLFKFDMVAACDIGWAQSKGLPLNLPSDTVFFGGSSRSNEFLEWRAGLGSLDLIMIDGDHSYDAVRADFEINRGFGHRFLALHDIANVHPSAIGVKKLWEELDGLKLEIIRPHIEMGLTETTMGIGIWSAVETPR
jgi:hypothetical protein